MTVKERISKVCHQSNQQGNGVLPPQVCPYCFGCPIATIVAGVSGRNHQTCALSIPKEHETDIDEWLGKLEAKILRAIRS